MNIKKYLYLSFGALFSQAAAAGSFAESFEGAPKLNINLYVFAANVDGSVGKGNMKYDVDQPFKKQLKSLMSRIWRMLT